MNDLSRFSGSWKSAAVISGVLNLGLIGALATVGFLKGVDALSTIALTLALIAFIAQLVIFAIQTTHSAEQLNQARELYQKTSELVADAGSRIDTTYQMVSSHNDVLLRMSSLKTEGILEHAPKPSPTSVGVTPGSGRSSSGSSNGDSRRVEEVASATNWPTTKDLADGLDVFQGLSENDVATLSVDVAHYLSSSQSGGVRGIIYTPQDDPLVELGLVAIEDGGDDQLVVPTDKGLLLARILFAPWPPPKKFASFRERILATREKASAGALTVVSGILNRTTGE